MVICARLRFAALVLFAATSVVFTAAAARAATAVRIEGNVALGARTLREAAAEELAGLQDSVRRAAAAADAAYQMESAGHRAGYAFIEVEYAITGEGANAAVTFTIREGPLVKLGEVTFTGNASFSAAQLRPLVAPPGSIPYVAADIREGRKNLRLHYRDQGFPDVTVAGPKVTLRADRTVADVAFEIVEGTRFVISSVLFEGDTLPDSGALFKRLASELQGQPFYERRKLSLANSVTSAFAAKGYPDAQVSVQEEPGAAAGNIVLRVSSASGPLVRISQVDVVGNQRTRASFIRSRVPVKAGDLYNEEKVYEGFRALYRTGVFSRVHYRLVGEGAERTLLIEVEEGPVREVSGEIGWGSYENLRGRVTFRDRNVFGSALGAGAEAGASTKSRFAKVDLLAPQFLGSDYSLDLPLSWSFREEPTFTEEKVELSLRLYRLFRGRVTAGLQYGFAFDGTSQLSPDVPPDARDEEHTSASIKANVVVDRRDSIFYPSRGWQTALSIEVADQRIGGTQDYVRCTAAGKLFRPLGAGFVLGLRLDSGFIVPTRGNEDIPVSDRFFTGGESTVRSFEEQQVGPKGPTGDPLGGLASTVAGVELRRRIFGRLAGSVFVDVGNVAPNQSLKDFAATPKDTADYIDAMWNDYFKDFRAGVGVGLQYLTPIGPMRLDAAWNPDPRAAENEESFAWHFSVGMAF